MSSTAASDSEVFTENELFKLRGSANGLLGLVLRVLSLTAVKKLLVQYSKAIDSSYNISLQNAHIIDFALHPVSCKSVQEAAES